MFNLIGNIINIFYKSIESYGVVLIIIGTIIGLFKIIKSFIKLQNYKKKKKIQPLLKEIENMDITDEEKEEKTYQLMKQNNFNCIPAIIVNILVGAISFMLFIVMINPIKYVGVSESFVEPFFYYNNIFKSSFDIIIPIIISILFTIGPELGRPINLIKPNELIKKLIMLLFSYIVLGSICSHVYMIYCLGLSIGQFLSDLIIIPFRRKAMK